MTQPKIVLSRVDAKTRAKARVISARAEGRPLTYQQALEEIAHEAGWSNSHEMIAGRGPAPDDDSVAPASDLAPRHPHSPDGTHRMLALTSVGDLAHRTAAPAFPPRFCVISGPGQGTVTGLLATPGQQAVALDLSVLDVADYRSIPLPGDTWATRHWRWVEDSLAAGTRLFVVSGLDQAMARVAEGFLDDLALGRLGGVELPDGVSIAVVLPPEVLPTFAPHLPGLPVLAPPPLAIGPAEFEAFLTRLHPSVADCLRGHREAVRFAGDPQDPTIPTAREWDCFSRLLGHELSFEDALDLALLTVFPPESATTVRHVLGTDATTP